MAIRVRDESEVSSEPNVVPLCDVLLVLLIIFMIATPLIQKGVDVTLPRALNTVEMPDNPDVILHIKKDGTMYVNQDEATKENLQLILEEAFMVANDNRLYLRADSSLGFGDLVDIIDIITAAGIDEVAIITEIKTEDID